MKSRRNRVIETRDLIKVYRTGEIEVQALRGLNLNVDKGELVSLIGPSGSGKSTLLNIIGGLDRASAGSVRVFGTDISGLKPSELVEFRRSTVGHVFQNMNLIPILTAAENVELPMAAFGVPKEDRRMRVKELCDVVGLTERMKHKPGELSGGEQQRVALAAALSNDPPLILADEPTGELDTKNARIVVNYLSKVNKEMGKTILMVTHDPNVARVADRILRIQDGVISHDVAPIVAGVDQATGYADQLRARIGEIDSKLVALDAQFRQSRITGEEYVEAQQELTQTRKVLRQELQRLGVVH